MYVPRDGAPPTPPATWADAIAALPGLRQWVRLNESSGTSFADSSGNGHPFTIPSGVTLGEPGGTGDGDTGVLGGGVQATIASNAWMDTVGSAWMVAVVKTTVTGSERHVYSRYTNNSNHALSIGVSSSNKGIVRARTSFGSGAMGTTTITDGKWHLLVGTWDGSQIKIYVDGVLEGTANLSGTLATGQTLRMGGGYGPSTWPSGDGIDDLAFGGGAGIPSADDIWNLWVISLGSFVDVVTSLSPSAWYRLGEAVGSTTFADSSGNGHDGFLTAGVTFGAPGLVAGDSDTAATLAPGCNSQVSYASWMDAPTALSLFAIVKTSTATGTPQILSRDETLARIWQLRFNAGKFEFVKIAGGVVTATTNPTTYADGAIHDFGATYDGSNIRLYVDGVKVVTQAAAGSLGTLGSRLFIGLRSTNTGGSDYWNGVEDEVLYKAGAVWTDSNFAALHATRI